MTAMHLILASLVVFTAAVVLGYAVWLVAYALNDDDVIHERLKQVTR